MSNLNLKPGIKIQMELISNFDHQKVYRYTSQLVDIIDESTIVIAAPVRRSRLITIPSSARVRLLFVNENRQLIGFLGTITESAHSANVPSLIVKINSEPVKIQRRRNFRLDCLLDADYAVYKYTHWDIDEMRKIPLCECKKALSRNVSGSGACIITNEELPKGTVIRLSIELDSNSRIDAMCKVIRCTKKDESLRNSQYELGLDFICISPQDKEKLVKYIFRQQRKLLKKGIKDHR